MKTWTVAELGGADRVLHFMVPGGIGDISWVYSKIRHLRSILGMPILMSSPEETPARAGDFVSLLPDAHWGGYIKGTSSWRVLSQALPSRWPAHQGWGPFLPRGYPVNISANMHLELGNQLANYLEPLPTDYHYPLAIPPAEIAAADAIIEAIPRPVFAVYVSNRDKENYAAGGWKLWTADQWTPLLASVAALPGCKGGSFVFLGASYDADKTQDVAGRIAKAGHAVARVVGQPLGVALRCLARANYCFSFPSGIGIMANVLRTPGVMLLPWLLKGLENAYADPFDLSAQRYRAWANPTPEEVYQWFRGVALPQVLAESGGKWVER